MKQLLTIFVLLLAMTCCTSEADRVRMRSCLDSINQRNRNDLPFTVQDVQPYVHFFDSHGTPNDRLLAHYLLGRAYHEAGEAPMALECYQKAAECADTLNADCDYPQLARVYAQMAQIFYEQGLYRDQLVFQQLSSEYAWKGKDTLAALMSYEQKSQAYFNLNMPDSLLYICEDVSSLYRKYGYNSYAATALGYTLDELVHRKEFEKARKYIQIYESESEFFDSLGNIEKGREIYYYVKGLYFLHTDALDSAEYYFRKELRDGRDFDCQNTGALGLSEIYQKHRRPDSVAKYGLYAYAMLDSMHSHLTSREVKRIQLLYDYTRNQKIAELEREKATKTRWISVIVLIAAALTVAGLSLLYRSNINQRKRRIRRLEHDLSNAISSHSEIQDELQHLLDKDYESVIAAKEEKLASLTETIELLQAENDVYKDESKRREANHPEQFISSDIAVSFIRKTTTPAERIMPTETEWTKLVSAFRKSNPATYKTFTSGKGLSKYEMRVCILLLLDIPESVIALMTDTTASTISNLKARANEKLFGKKEAHPLKSNLTEALKTAW